MTTNRKASLILLTFCAFFAYMTTQISAATLPGAPGPRTFPWILLSLLAILSVMLFFDGGPEKKKEPLGKAMAIYATVCFYVALVPFVGFLLGTAAGIFIFFYWTISSRKKAAIAAVLTAVILYVLFQYIFHIKLPSGMIF